MFVWPLLYISGDSGEASIRRPRSARIRCGGSNNWWYNQEVDSSSKSNSNQSFEAWLILEHVPLPGGKRRWKRVEYLKGAIVGFKEKGESWTRDLFTIWCEFRRLAYLQRERVCGTSVTNELQRIPIIPIKPIPTRKKRQIGKGSSSFTCWGLWLSWYWFE